MLEAILLNFTNHSIAKKIFDTSMQIVVENLLIGFNKIFLL